MSQHWWSGWGVTVVKLIERLLFCDFVFQKYTHYRNKHCTFIGYHLPYKISLPLSKPKAPLRNLKYSLVSHVVIADCTQLKVWQLRDLIWRNVHTDVQEHGKCWYGDTPTATHRHTHRPRRTREHKTHATCLENIFLFYFNFKKDFKNVRMALAWTSEGLQRLILYCNS